MFRVSVSATVGEDMSRVIRTGDLRFHVGRNGSKNVPGVFHGSGLCGSW